MALRFMIATVHGATIISSLLWAESNTTRLDVDTPEVVPIAGEHQHVVLQQSFPTLDTQEPTARFMAGRVLLQSSLQTCSQRLE